MASEAHRAVEAILMVADAPVDPGLLAQLLEVGPGRIEEICAELSRAYDDEDRGWIIARVAGGYRFQSHPDLAPYVERFVLEGQSARLSAAALETLAIVAYKQPVSRAQISAIRGVNADGVLRTLEQRGYIAEVARDPGPGQALLYGTTDILLERLGLDSLADLPPLAAFVPGPEVMEALEHSLRFDREPRDGPVADAGPGNGATQGDGPDGNAAVRPPDAPAPDAPAPDLPAPDVRAAASAEDEPGSGAAAGGPEHRARVAAESAPGTDESGIDDFRAEDLRGEGFHADDFHPADFHRADIAGADSGDGDSGDGDREGAQLRVEDSPSGDRHGGDLGAGDPTNEDVAGGDVGDEGPDPEGPDPEDPDAPGHAELGARPADPPPPADRPG